MFRTLLLHSAPPSVYGVLDYYLHTEVGFFYAAPEITVRLAAGPFLQCPSISAPHLYPGLVATGLAACFEEGQVELSWR